MIARRIRLAAGIAAACLLSSGVAVAADEDAELKSPDTVTEKEVQDMRDEAAAEGSELPKESWTSGQSQPSDSDSAQAEQGATPLEQDDMVTDKEIKSLRERAEHREPMTKESWTSGRYTRPATEGEEDDDNSKNKDDE